MNKIILILIIGLGIGLFFFNQSRSQTDDSVLLTSSSEQTDQESLPAENSQIISAPQTLRIPKLNVETTVEHVGLDEKKNMDVPKDWENAAWYNLGYKVGDKGSAVIAAHYDEPDGSPGVFYEISELETGDEIFVEGNGKSLSYTVVRSETFKHDEVPIEEVFGPSDEKRLNLITCSGVFDKTDKNYSNRLIVYSILKE